MLFTRNTRAPSTRVRFCLETRIFFSSVGPFVQTYPAKTVTKNILSKTLFRVEIFKNAILLYSYGRMKTEVFENDYVTVLDPA